MNAIQIWIRNINNCGTQSELDRLIDNYLRNIDEDPEEHIGKTFAESARKLGGDRVLLRAEVKWFELDDGDEKR